MRGLNKFILPVALGLAAGLGSCDFYDLDAPAPNDAVVTSSAFTSLQTARLARAGLYNSLQLSNDFDGYLSSWQYFSDESDWTGTFPTREQFDIYQVIPTNATMAGFYSDYYEAINIANTLIAGVEGIQGDPALTEERRASLIGEARFVRALMYFYLNQGWVDVPLITTPTTSTGPELFVASSPSAQVVKQIEDDLTFAATNVIDDETLGISQAAALGLHARVKFYQRQYAEASALATQALDAASVSVTGNAYLDDAIFTVDYSSTDGNAFAFFYYNSARNGRYSIRPSKQLIAAFEPGDRRFPVSIDTITSRTNPVGTKYKDFAAASGSQSDPLYVLRASEMNLIIGESAARAGDFAKAQTFLNEVRTRAGLPSRTDLNASNFEDIFLKEFFTELAMEGGHRLWNVRRVGKAEQLFGPDGYDPCDDRWPFPQRELDRNPNLVKNSACSS